MHIILPCLLKLLLSTHLDIPITLKMDKKNPSDQKEERTSSLLLWTLQLDTQMPYGAPVAGDLGKHHYE